MRARSIALVLALGAVPAVATPEPVPHLVVFSSTFGYRHAGIPGMVATIEHLGRVSGGFTVEHVTDPEAFGPDLYARADAIMFLQTTGTPPFDEAERSAFLRFFGCGGAFVGIHAASDSGPSWTGYTDLIGARFSAHPHFGSMESYVDAVWEGLGQEAPVRVGTDVPLLSEMTINVEDRTHPATAPWHGAPTFRYSDEFYRYQSDPRAVPDLDVLLSLENESDYWPLAGTVPNPRPTAGSVNPWLGYTDDTPLSWTKPYGDGRVFYTNLGHNPSTWERLDFQSHLLGGLVWATEVRPDPVCVAG